MDNNPTLSYRNSIFLSSAFLQKNFHFLRNISQNCKSRYMRQGCKSAVLADLSLGYTDCGKG
jgi:hypothetical protein